MATEKSPQDHRTRVLPETDQGSSGKCSTNDPCSLLLVSRETRLIHKATYPQGCPIMSHSPSKSSTATSSAPPAPIRAQPSQPDPSLLVSLGIKVRDFAYESTLPPIAPVPRVPRQVQPGPRPLKRARRDSNENEDESFSQSSVRQAGPSTSNAGESEGAKKSKPLERKPTEPASDTNHLTSTRARAFTDLSLHESSNSRALQPQSSSIQFPAGSTKHQSVEHSPHSQHSLPPLQIGSQESEPYIHTPLVTPNGSLQWPVPTSQLDDGSQIPIPELTSCSPQPKDPQEDESPLLDPSPAAAVSLPSDAPSRLLLPSPSLTNISKAMRPSSPTQHTTLPNSDSEDQDQSTLPGSTSPRYFLRKRSAVSPKSPPRPPRARPSRLHPSSRQHFSMQATHSASKSHSGRGSPSARTLRKNGNEESMVMT